MRWTVQTARGVYKVRANSTLEAQRKIKQKYGKTVLITKVRDSRDL